MTTVAQPVPTEAFTAQTGSSFPLTIREISTHLITTNQITHSLLGEGPGGFGIALQQGKGRDAQVNALLNIQPTFTIGLSMDGSSSMNGSTNDVRKNMAPWLINTVVVNSQKILEEAKDALAKGLEDKLVAGEKKRLMEQGLKVVVRTAVVGDSRHPNNEYRTEDVKTRTLIDDPPLEMVIAEEVFKLSDTPEEREKKAQILLKRITDYSPTMYGGANRGESIPEGIAAVAGVIGGHDGVIPLLAKMVAHYEKYGKSEIQPLITYLRGLMHLSSESKSHTIPADLLVAATDEEPATDNIIVGVPDIASALNSRKTPTFILTPKSLKEDWAQAVTSLNATHLNLEDMAADGVALDLKMRVAIEDGIQKTIIKEFKLLTG